MNIKWLEDQWFLMGFYIFTFVFIVAEIRPKKQDLETGKHKDGHNPP